jgi:hypothetical protein
MHPNARGAYDRMTAKGVDRDNEHQPADKRGRGAQASACQKATRIAPRPQAEVMFGGGCVDDRAE